MKRYSKQRSSTRVAWDETNLNFLEANKTPKRKITEPKTPYHASEGTMNNAEHAQAIWNALSEVASSSDRGKSRDGEGWASEGEEDNGDYDTTDYKQEQDMEIEALQAILMDDITELDPSECGLKTTLPCFQITLSPEDDDEESSTGVSVRLALIFAHTQKYPDEPPLLQVRSLRGVKTRDLEDLKTKLDEEAMGNLGMAMIYTLVTFTKEWLHEQYNEDPESEGDGESDEESKDEVIEPHGEAVTVETFLAWRERFEAERALERARLIPDAALIASKEKRLSGRAWFESGAGKGVKATVDFVEEQDEEELDFEEDFDDGDIDEDDMLEHYLAGKADNTYFRG